jgi:hypothetical protein
MIIIQSSISIINSLLEIKNLQQQQQQLKNKNKNDSFQFLFY